MIAAGYRFIRLLQIGKKMFASLLSDSMAFDEWNQKNYFSPLSALLHEITSGKSLKFCATVLHTIK